MHMYCNFVAGPVHRLALRVGPTFVAGPVYRLALLCGWSRPSPALLCELGTYLWFDAACRETIENVRIVAVRSKIQKISDC